MRRSKLEMHIDVLKALAFHGRLKPTHIMYKAKVNCGVLKQCLHLLLQHNLVTKQAIHEKRNKTRVIYAITERGLTALRNVQEINNVIPIFEEENTPSLDLLSGSQNISERDFR